LISAARFIASSLVLLGCGDNHHPTPDAAPCVINGAAEVTLGTGPEDGMGYLPMVDGQTVTLTFGVQQGFHVWTNIRARNVCFHNLKVKRTATLVSNGELFSNSSDQLTLVAASDPTLAAQGWGELPDSRPTFMCPNITGMPLPGQMVRIDVEITDTDGRTASDHHVVIPECPDNSFFTACENQCNPGTDGGM
jgi:hypothetical protein